MENFVLEVIGRGFVFLFCFAILLNPPFEHKVEQRPTQPYYREIEYRSMGRDSILYHLPRKQ